MSSKSALSKLGVCAGLAAITLVVFWPLFGHAFVNYDDDVYVTANPHVRAGLTLESLRWAWTSGWAANWHPLTWMSHMLDVELFGVDPAGHHLSSLILHTINALLLFLLLERMTGALWRSAIVAALFAVHPLHVESVAWIAERKDVLSTLFWLLTTWAYLGWTRKPGALRYALLLATFALGLCAKPMLVTLPFTLLLLDLWPLRRSVPSGRGAAGWWPRVREKIPLFALSALSSVVTIVVQRGGSAVVPVEIFGIGVRLANAVMAYAVYLWKALWPAGLTAFYPHGGADQSAGGVVVAAVGLVVITVLAFRSVRSRPYLLVGWLWYLGTLVPVIGLVQVGAQAMADRYTYVPLIGLFVALVWGLADLPASWAGRGLPERPILVAVSVAAVAVLMIGAHRQAGHWKDSATLFEHALAVDPANAVAHGNLGLTLAARGRVDEAIEHYRAALDADPSLFQTRTNLAHALVRRGRLEEAARHLLTVLDTRPDYPQAVNCKGILEFEQGRFDEAARYFTRAAELKPWYADAHANLGLARAKQGRWDEAVGHYLEAVRLRESSSGIHVSLGEALEQTGDVAGAAEHYRLARGLDPEDATAHYRLGLLAARQEKPEDAISHLEQALRADPEHAEAHYNLGTLLARSGDLPAASRHLSTATDLRDGYAMAHYNLGAVLRLMGDSEGAARQIETARRLGYRPAGP